MGLLAELLAVLVLVKVCTGLCHDIDTKACESMSQQNPGLCSDSALATTACPKFCRKCSSLVCYHCSTSVQNVMDCNTTRTCQPGEQCILHELTSSRDGHHEYRMRCATLDMCDGTGVLFGRRDLKSRDIRTHCCTDDLCNYPTTTTQPPITHAACNRDIEILIQDSADSPLITYMIRFLKEMISRIDIGPLHNQVGLSLIDGGTHSMFHLNSYSNKPELLRALDEIKFRYRTNAMDVNDVIHFLNNDLKPDKTSNGNRLAYENSVIIIVQHEGDATGPAHHHSHHETLKVYPSSVVVMNVGTGNIDQLSALATDPRHVIDVADYTLLAQHVSNVINLLCL